MPTLAEATTPLNPQYYQRELSSPASVVTPPPVTNQDTLYSIRGNVNLRSPSPPINVSPDNLRQYYRGGQAPQYRVLSPPTLAVQAAAAGGSTVTTVVAGSSTTSSTVVASPSARTVGLVTPSLNVGQIYPTIIQVAKAFDVLRFGVNFPARIQMYKTAAMQAADLSRPMTQPVPIGTQHGIICDMKLQQSSELSWKNSPDFPGSNGDSPQSTAVYITITNIGVAAAAISVTITFVPWES